MSLVDEFAIPLKSRKTKTPGEDEDDEDEDDDEDDDSDEEPLRLWFDDCFDLCPERLEVELDFIDKLADTLSTTMTIRVA